MGATVLLAPRGVGMLMQKSAEVIVGVRMSRRAEQGMPRVGGGNTRTVDEGRRDTASDYPDGGVGAER
jgi:hypothetical protein